MFYNECEGSTVRRQHMAKRNHNVDFITDLQERADHNINPYYWFNRVTPFTIARWNADKWFNPLFFVMYSLMGGLILLSLYNQARQAHQTFGLYVFDFSNAFTTARCTGLLLFSFLWIVFAISTGQSVPQVILTAMLPKPKRRRERKKRYPRRPKNYR